MPTVAILDYETGTTDNADFGKQIADLLTVRLSVEDGFELVERAKLDRILQEQKLKLTGLADQEKAVEVGKLLGAQLMIIGKTFTMDKHLLFVTKVVGVETGRVKGAISKAEPTKDRSEAIFKMSEGVAELIRTQGAKLLPDGAGRPDPVAEIRKALGDRTPATVAVIIPEQHVTRRVVDPAVETEIKSVLVACGFRVVDTGMNDLADWAKKRMKGEEAPWPTATRDADVIVVGEAFSEFALRTGDLVTCTARAEINAIDRHSGRILLADRATQRAVDLNELTAGKTALQKAGRKLALAIARTLVTYEGKGAAPQEPDPALMPAQRPVDRTGHAVARRRSTACGASTSTPTAAAAPAAAPGAKVGSRTLFAVPLENETADEQYDPAASGLGDLVAVLLAQQRGLILKDLPCVPLLRIHSWVRVGGPDSGPILVNGLELYPTLQRLPKPGAVDVRCLSTAHVLVEVDGVPCRQRPGRVGLLRPGKHEVALRPTEEGTPFGRWSATVDVVAGQVTPVSGSLPWADGIVIDIGKGDFEEVLAVPYGRPVLVDGRLFEVAVSEADMQVSASPYGGPVGFVRMGKPFWKATLGAGDAAFDICGGPDPVPLPPGTYEILSFSEWPTPDIAQPGNYLTIRRQWTDHSGFASKPVPPFTVVAGKTADVAVGSPIRASLTVRKESGAVVFRLQAYDAGGRFMPRIEHNRNIHWYQKNPTSVDVKDARGRVVARCEMDWRQHQCEARWPIPPGVRGAYSAVLNFAAGPFEARTSPVSFTAP